MKKNVVLDKSFEFALRIIDLYIELTNHKESVLSKQLLKSGTSIGANVEESVAAQSRKDFISKLSIASKEARETRYWLLLLQKSQLVPLNYSEMIQYVEELNRILTSIIKTSKES